MRTPEAEARFRSRRALMVDRVLDLDPELRAELAVKALMILATDMPAIASVVLDEAEAMTVPQVGAKVVTNALLDVIRGKVPVQR